MSSSNELEFRCLQCDQSFSRSSKHARFVCGALRSHILQKSACFDAYMEDNLISRGKTIDIHTSLVRHPATSPIDSKRKALCNPPKVPPPKWVIVNDLPHDILHQNFGSHVQSTMLLKGESFGDKTHFRRGKKRSVVSAKELNHLFCHG